MQKNDTIAICGAGIAGVATAYYLSQSNSKLNIILIDKNQPLSFTTSKSGENFRDFWPQKSMRDFSIQSIRLMKALKNVFGTDAFKMSFSGYNFISCDSEAEIFATNLGENSKLFFSEIIDAATITAQFSYLSKSVKRVVSIKNAGNIDVYAMGSLLLREAKNKGVKIVRGEIIGIAKSDTNYEIALDTNEKITADKIVIASGPFINHIANMVGLTFPIENTLQRKFIIPDPKKVIRRDMPFTIYADSQYLNWSKEEIDFFKTEKKYNWLLEKFPGGLHIKPEGEGIKLGWAFNTANENPKWENSPSDFFPQIVLKGASRFIPQLSEYENNIPTPLIEYAGYYTRTQENLPLIGQTENPNVFVIGALSGFGTMTACAAGELCTKYILNESELPDYAPYFHPNRYKNKAILEEIRESQSDGQL